ncbi:MAG: hypothetical protein RMK49_06195 [Abditibacteriales bacterium]|nr:hypothetical protein [Abditibacteriales bacterium]
MTTACPAARLRGGCGERHDDHLSAGQPPRWRDAPTRGSGRRSENPTGVAHRGTRRAPQTNARARQESNLLVESHGLEP